MKLLNLMPVPKLHLAINIVNFKCQSNKAYLNNGGNNDRLLINILISIYPK